MQPFLAAAGLRSAPVAGAPLGRPLPGLLCGRAQHRRGGHPGEQPTLCRTRPAECAVTFRSRHLAGLASSAVIRSHGRAYCGTVDGDRFFPCRRLWWESSTAGRGCAPIAVSRLCRRGRFPVSLPLTNIQLPRPYPPRVGQALGVLGLWIAQQAVSDWCMYLLVRRKDGGRHRGELFWHAGRIARAAVGFARHRDQGEAEGTAFSCQGCDARSATVHVWRSMLLNIRIAGTESIVSDTVSPKFVCRPSM